MNLRKVQDKADSLGLLFDTICNAFGGIIVIAVLVALMSHEIKQSEDAAKSEQSQQQIMARRIAHAKKDLAEVESVLAGLRAQVDALDPNRTQEIQKKDDLAQQLKALQSQVQADQSTLESLHRADAVSDPGQKKQEIAKQQSDSQKIVRELQKQIDKTTTDIQQLEQRSTELVTKINVASKPAVKSLRLPKEHDSGKIPWYIVIKGGELFSKHLLTAEGMESNPSIFSVETNGDDEKWTPLEGKGVSGTDKDSITKIIADALKSGSFVYFVVYEDSFSTFISARDNAILQGVEYGWSPKKMSDSIVFSTDGTAPKPQ